MQTIKKLKRGIRIVKMNAGEVRKIEREVSAALKLIWTVWYLDSKDVDTFEGAFPSREEARQHIAEGLPQRRASWRYCIEGVDPRSFQTVSGE